MTKTAMQTPGFQFELLIPKCIRHGLSQLVGSFLTMDAGMMLATRLEVGTRPLRFANSTNTQLFPSHLVLRHTVSLGCVLGHALGLIVKRTDTSFVLHYTRHTREY